MEKLTLENIAPFLPYGLKGNYKRLKYPFVDEIAELDTSILNRLFGNTPYTFKPILRPMDLTKPIKNGVVPAIEIAKFMDNGHNHTDSQIKQYPGVISIATNKCDDIHDVKIHLSTMGQISAIKMDGNNAMFETIRRVNKWLYANFFDVDGLIEKGLAIDVNTLETNPYN